MSIIRSYVNGFEVTDLTDNLLVIPNVWGLTQQLGLFGTEGVTQETITLEEIESTFGLLQDRVRGQRAVVNSDDVRKMHAFAVPHFNLDDYITPRDIAGKRAYGSEREETLAAVRARKLERIRKSHAATLEAARMHTIVNGTAFAPNGTVVYDWYAEFGKTREVVPFVLGTATTNVIEKIEEVIAYIQDNAFTGEVVGDIIGLCSPEFFAALISHPTMVEAYKYYTSQGAVQILRDRLTAARFDSRYREFYHAGILFIEYRGGFQGDFGAGRYIPAGDAYFMPENSSDNFKTFFAPAGKFDMIGSVGQEAYAFEYADPRGEAITLESETNFLSVLRKPQMIVRGTVA